MGRRREDAIDVACREWARERRRVLGIDQPLTASEYVGALRSTLGKRRDLHAGARSDGLVIQEFPECYQGTALEVNRAFRSLRPELRDVLDVHYVARAPVEDKATALAMSVAKYWQCVAMAKSFVEGWLTR